MMTWDSNDEKIVALALRLSRNSIADTASGSDVVMETMKGIVDIERRMHVSSYRVASNRACWVNYIQADLTQADREEILKQRWLEVAQGDPLDIVFGFRLEATPQEQDIMESVTRVFKACLVGRNQVRDWKILFAFAKGKSVRAVGRRFKISHQRAKECRDMQCAAIWTQVKHLLPAQNVGTIREAAAARGLSLSQ